MVQAVDLLYMMKKIRAVEETIAELYPQQEMRCPVHLSTGQEGPAAAVCLNLRKTDTVVSGHRAHAHYLAKGGNARALVDELYGLRSGCSRGYGGSMHLIDESVGFMGSTAIVGGTIPVGVGLGWAHKLQKTDRVSVIFLGDGAVEEGVFFESANFAAVHKLPILFVCENNGWSVTSPLSVRQPKGRKISDMVRALGIPSAQKSGALAVKAAEDVESLLDRIRGGSGPYFIEFSTERWRIHCGHEKSEQYGKDCPIEPLSRMWTSELEKKLNGELHEIFRGYKPSP